jgi:hypothetical protein
LANLDLNSDGTVSYLETYTASPVSGTISGNNQALTQRITNLSGFDSTGRPAYPAISGIPVTMKNYLINHPEINCSMANYMRSSAVASYSGAPGAPTQNVPVGLVLDPCNTGTTKVDYRRNGSFEREQNAKQNLIYLDLIYDTNPDFTAKNQLYFDRLDSFKDSQMPYGEKQDIHAFEEKVTVTKKISQVPQWLGLEALASVNYRDTRGNIHSTGGDFDYRQDIMRGNGHLYSNNQFTNQLEDQSYATGAPLTSNRTSQFQEMGIGAMFDVKFFKHTDLTLGGRFDYAQGQAQNLQYFNANIGQSPAITTAGKTAGQVLDDQTAFMARCTTAANAALTQVLPTLASYPYPVTWGALPGGTASPSTNPYTAFIVDPATGRRCPGAYITPFAKAKSYDTGFSYSISLAQELPWGLHPYVTIANESLTLDSSNNIFDPGVLWNKNPGNPTNEGIIGEAKLKEVGIKASLFHEKLFLTLDGYEQTRNDVTANVDPGAGADVASIKYRGVEFEFKFVPFKELYLGGYVLGQKGKYIVDATFNAEVSARQVGFQDVVDPATGAVYPAEAFFYGGRYQAVIPAGQSQYRDRAGDPQIQAGLNGTYKIGRGFGVLVSSNYFDATWANRLKTIRLPKAITIDTGITYDKNKWQLRLSGYNVFDERYWQAAAGDSNGFLVTAKPGATWELQVKKSF